MKKKILSGEGRKNGILPEEGKGNFIKKSYGKYRGNSVGHDLSFRQTRLGEIGISRKKKRVQSYTTL